MSSTDATVGVSKTRQANAPLITSTQIIRKRRRIQGDTARMMSASGRLSQPVQRGNVTSRALPRTASPVAAISTAIEAPVAVCALQASTPSARAAAKSSP
ncbi:MAG: hypothetical protein R2849_08885 [Thermomicrobiales bacterium]